MYWYHNTFLMEPFVYPLFQYWMASLTQWTWVWVNSGSWWWTGTPGMLWFMGSQRVGHDWATELNWTISIYFIHSYIFFYHYLYVNYGCVDSNYLSIKMKLLLLEYFYELYKHEHCRTDLLWRWNGHWPDLHCRLITFQQIHQYQDLDMIGLYDISTVSLYIPPKTIIWYRLCFLTLEIREIDCLSCKFA